jgi:hypothetical protein
MKVSQNSRVGKEISLEVAKLWASVTSNFESTFFGKGKSTDFGKVKSTP